MSRASKRPTVSEESESKVAVIPSCLPTNGLTQTERLLYEWGDTLCALLHAFLVNHQLCDVSHSEQHAHCTHRQSRSREADKGKGNDDPERLSRFLRGRATPLPGTVADNDKDDDIDDKSAPRSHSRRCVLASIKSLKEGITDLHKRVKSRTEKKKDLSVQVKALQEEVDELRKTNDELRELMTKTATSESLSAQTQMLTKALSKAMEDVAKEREKASKIARAAHNDTMQLKAEIEALKKRLGAAGLTVEEKKPVGKVTTYSGTLRKGGKTGSEGGLAEVVEEEEHASDNDNSVEEEVEDDD